MELSGITAENLEHSPLQLFTGGTVRVSSRLTKIETNVHLILFLLFFYVKIVFTSNKGCHLCLNQLEIP